MKLKRGPLYIGVAGGLVLALALLVGMFDRVPEGAFGNIAVTGFVLILVLEAYMYFTNRNKKNTSSK